MELPFVLDITISLIFIYLILSLLASEIQELLTALFQWRAKHLKESIKNLLDGGQVDRDELEIKELVEELYNHPLLKNVNQEARGIIARKLRGITWLFSNIYRNLTKQKQGGFGDRYSGPSYISSETFATTLIETLKIPDLIKTLVESRLEKLAKKIISNLEEIAKVSNVNLENNSSLILLTQELSNIINDFELNKASLLTSIEQMSASVEQYIKPSFQNENLVYFYEQARAYKSNLFGENNEKIIILSGLRPSLNEIITALDLESEIHNEIKTKMIFRNHDEYQTIAGVLRILPKSMQHSLTVIARRAETRTQKIESEIHQLIGEISIWFDRSMVRASGVYKRNAKGVAILLGLVIAFVVNADTCYILNSLSNNDSLRQVITERASQVSLNYPNSETINRSELERIKAETNLVLKDISLPIGWNPNNLSEQLGCYFNNVRSTDSISLNRSQEWISFFDRCLSNPQSPATSFLPQKIAEVILAYPWAAIQMIVGWFLSGIAIAMGAPFWFDLLSKVVNVRNTGSKPLSASNEANSN